MLVDTRKTALHDPPSEPTITISCRPTCDPIRTVAASCLLMFMQLRTEMLEEKTSSDCVKGFSYDGQSFTSTVVMHTFLIIKPPVRHDNMVMMLNYIPPFVVLNIKVRSGFSLL